ncbi:MAG: DUF5996 family protein [Alphaproteobacteria bacterium]|nr:DUF5996 family protein [Alphaproteobacteria bacterium]
MPPALDLPPLPLEAWEDTKETLHLFLQIVGKIRLKAHPKLNHWWHVTLYPSSRGISTRRIPFGGADFEIAFDFVDHTVTVSHCDRGERTFGLLGLSVADFHGELFSALGALGIEVEILGVPYDKPYKTPFDQDTEHSSYDGDKVHAYWRALTQIASVFEEFRGRFLGKSTPVHLFWHSFDLALTRFSGKKAPPMEGGTKADKEAYSHEVISFGWWAGDDQVREAAFYSYTAPEPAGIETQPLEPSEAVWNDAGGSHMAFVTYEAVRQSADPRATLLAFLESAYQAGATKAGWPVEDFTHQV